MEKVSEITKKQQRFTLASKKKKPKTAFKNVLAHPFPRYWPQLNDADSIEFFKKLESLKNSCPDFFQAKETDKGNKIVYGIRSVIQKINQGKCDILVLSADLKPRYVINQIILLALAQNHNVNVFCIQNLSEKLSNCVTFPCFAFVLKIENRSCEHTNKMMEWCLKTKAQKHPVPNSIIRYYSFKSKKELLLTDAETDLLMVENKRTEKKQDEAVNFNALYITKQSKTGARIFIPDNAKNLKPQTITPATSGQSDFISLSNSTNLDDKNEMQSNAAVDKTIYMPFTQILSGQKKRKWNEKKTISHKYHNLTVHKIQGNPEKVKKEKKKKVKK